MTGLLRRLRRRLRREDGNATVEFVILFPLYIAVMFTGIEAGLLMTRQVMLERAVDLSLRDLRLGQMEDPSAERLREAICANTVVIANCRDVLLLELRPVDTATWGGLNDPVACIDRDEEIQPVTQFQAGGDNQLMLVNVCIVIDPVVPTSALALALPRDPSGGIRLLSASVFVNEPS